MEKWIMSRRSFLRLAGVTGAVAAGGVFSFADWLQAAEKQPVMKINTVCNSCGNRCGLVAHVKNGRLWKITGQPGHPKNRGNVCPRGHAHAAYVYSPDRLTQPLKRVGDQFQPIPWEQAYREIGEKLAAIREKYGPQAIYWHEYDKPTTTWYSERLMLALGSPNWTMHYTTCAAGRTVGYMHTIGGVAGADFPESRYIVLIGRSYADGIIPASMKGILAAKEKGAKIVCVDPRYNNTAMIAHEWLPVKPGTDMALLLAWAHVIVGEELYDIEIIEKYSVGFNEFKEMVKEYTPAWASQITGIPAETITRIAREMAAARPKALLDPGWHGAYGAHYINSTDTARVHALLNALLGNINQPGGIWFPKSVKFGQLDPAKHPEPPKVTLPRADGAGVPGKFPLAHKGNGIQIVYPSLAKKGKVKAGLLYATNPVRSNPDPKHVIEGLRQLELCVVIDIQMSETAETCAHYILPEAHYLERDEIPEAVAGRQAFVTRRHKALEPMHPETKGSGEIITGIAKASGVGQYFNFTLDEVTQAMLAPLNISPQVLKEKGTIPVGEPVKPGFPVDASGNPNLNTPSKKIHFLNEKFAQNGFNALPKWIPPKVTPKDNEFRLLHGHQSIHTHTMTNNHPHLLQIAKDYHLHYLWMNASRARALGINDGDWVTVKSKNYTAKARVKVTERLHPEAIWFPGAYGVMAKGQRAAYGFGVNMNDFIAYDIDPISGHAMQQETILTVEKGVV